MNDEFDHRPLGEADLRALVSGFRGHTDFALVCCLAFTGCRRNEALALRPADLDAAAKTLRIERSLEVTKAAGYRFKGPKRTPTSARSPSTLTSSRRCRARLTGSGASMPGSPMAPRSTCRWSGCRPRR